MRKSTFVDMLQERYGNLPLVGVEVGVSKGSHALYILKKLNMQKLYLIDKYTTSDPDQELSKDDQKAHSHLKAYKAQIQWMHMKSEDALLLLPRNGLDFVYIDADHRYQAVKKDIELSLPALRRNAVLGGHDYDIHKWPPVGVRKAVDEFVKSCNYRLTVSTHGNWWIISDFSYYTHNGQ